MGLIRSNSWQGSAREATAALAATTVGSIRKRFRGERWVNVNKDSPIGTRRSARTSAQRPVEPVSSYLHSDYGSL